jgi:hypothetical protein
MAGMSPQRISGLQAKQEELSAEVDKKHVRIKELEKSLNDARARIQGLTVDLASTEEKVCCLRCTGNDCYTLVQAALGLFGWDTCCRSPNVHDCWQPHPGKQAHRMRSIGPGACQGIYDVQMIQLLLNARAL